MSRTLAGVFFLALLTGCQSVEWTQWQYEGIDTKPLEQAVRVESTPSGATVYMDDKQVGVTPFPLSVGYSETAAIFKREQVERKGLEKKILNTETERRNTTQNPSPVNLRLNRPHYFDAHTAFVAPTTRAVTVRLEPFPYDWELKTVEEGLRRTQKVTVKTSPVAGASVFMEGKLVGVTPFTIELPYAETEMVFEKKIIRETGESAPNIDVSTRRDSGGVTEGVFELVCKREGYLDKLAVVRVPEKSSKVGEPAEVVISLSPAPGIHDIECTLRFTARLEYFAEIQKKVEAYTVPRGDGTAAVVGYPPETPERVAPGLNVYTRTFFTRVKNADAFNTMLGELKNMASERGLLLDIVNVRVGAEFNTNAALAGIEHRISGQVRPGSALYLVEPGRVPKPKEASPLAVDGSYSFTVALPAGVSDCYLASVYVPPEPRYSRAMTVFVKIDVHTEKQVEITQADFEKGTGVKFDSNLVETLAPRWPQARLAAFDRLREELLRRIRDEAKNEQQANWIRSVDRNMDTLRRVGAERDLDEGVFPFPETRKWLNNELGQTGE